VNESFRELLSSKFSGQYSIQEPRLTARYADSLNPASVTAHYSDCTLRDLKSASQYAYEFFIGSTIYRRRGNPYSQCAIMLADDFVTRSAGHNLHVKNQLALLD